jgi:hypothetical protein
MDRAHDYLERAARVQEMAEAAKFPDVRTALLDVANQWRVLADHATRASSRHDPSFQPVERSFIPRDRPSPHGDEAGRDALADDYARIVIGAQSARI